MLTMTNTHAYNYKKLKRESYERIIKTKPML